jgi:chromosome segregation ATPase
MMITAVVFGIIGGAIIIGAAFFLKRTLLFGGGAQTASMQAEIDQVALEIEKLTALTKEVGSKKQVDYLEEQLAQQKKAYDSEKVKLKEIETKLESAQKMVEEKEGSQQEAKTQLDEDENRIKKLIEAYQTLSGEAIALERKLATSMKSLEATIGEIKATEEQKTTLNDLMIQLTDAGANLRELITEYETVHQRITVLNQQHKDLEDEYTKLVEQQLGE